MCCCVRPCATAGSRVPLRRLLTLSPHYSARNIIPPVLAAPLPRHNVNRSKIWRWSDSEVVLGLLAEPYGKFSTCRFDHLVLERPLACHDTIRCRSLGLLPNASIVPSGCSLETLTSCTITVPGNSGYGAIVTWIIVHMPVLQKLEVRIKSDIDDEQQAAVKAARYDQEWPARQKQYVFEPSPCHRKSRLQ